MEALDSNMLCGKRVKGDRKKSKGVCLLSFAWVSFKSQMQILNFFCSAWLKTSNIGLVIKEIAL